jgi:hypothetical protein
MAGFEAASVVTLGLMDQSRVLPGLSPGMTRRLLHARLDAVDVLVGEAQMMADLVDQHMAHHAA